MGGFLIKKITVLQDALNPLVAPDAVRVLDLMEGMVEREDDLADRLTCVGRSGLQPHDPTVKVHGERPEHMYVKVALGDSGEQRQKTKGNDEQTRCKTQSSEMRDRTCAAGRRRTSCQREC